MAADIVVKNLSKYYGEKAAIRNLNFSFRQGEVVGFLGASGAGKSTILRILCGSLPATQGCVYINHLALTTHNMTIKRQLGYMSENNPLPQMMQVEEFLQFQAQLKHVKNVKQSVNAVMEQCDLQWISAKKMIGTLSKGFQQRIGIAAAFLGGPHVVILDEPTTGLDPQQVFIIRDLLKQFREKSTIIFSGRILSEVEATCTRLLVLHQGKLVANETPYSLRQHYFKNVRYGLILANENKGEISEESTLFSALKQTNFPIHCINYMPRENNCQFILETSDTSRQFTIDFNIWLFKKDFKVQQFFKIEPSLEDLLLKITQLPLKNSDFAA